MDKKGITVAGSIVVDSYFSINNYPKQGNLVTIKERKMDIGGSGNLIVGLAKMDSSLQVKVSAVVGKDDYGRFIRNTLNKYPNILQDNVTMVTGVDTSVTMVMDAQETQQRTFFYLPGGNDLYNESFIDWDQIDAKIFHLEYLLLMEKIDGSDEVYGTHGAKILSEAKKRNMKTSIDVASEISEHGGKVVRAALQYTDYCTINEIEAEMVTGLSLLEDDVLIEENIYKALHILKELGVSTWAIIHSPSYNYGLDCKNGTYHKVKSLELPVDYIKGTTGAGDAFCCGVLYAAYLGKGIKEGMELGCACAGFSLSEVSGTAGMRSYEKVLEVSKRYKGD